MTKEHYIEAWTKILLHGVLAVLALFFLYVIRDVVVALESGGLHEDFIRRTVEK